jgi:nucleotide-binding universal stress UspA family protein
VKRFKKLLAVINGGSGDAHVTHRAIALAKANKAQLMFCTIHDAPGPTAGLLTGSEPYKKLTRVLRQERKTLIDQAVQTSRDSGQPARGRLLEGKPFLNIIQEVLRSERDLVLFPDDQVPSLRSRLFGSTATHLLRKCPCPVWVLKPTAVRRGRLRFKRVLAAVNAATSQPTEESLNVKILELATSLAEREGADIHVVHCWSVYGESILAAPRGPLNTSEIESYLKDTRAKHQSALNALLTRFFDEGHTIHKHMLKGEPDNRIPEIAAKLAADVVVMGTVARTGINGVFIGNTAENVLQRIGRSVLAVKPDGFVSPVTLDDPDD